MKSSVMLALLFLGALPLVEAAGPRMMQPRVPEAQLEEARALTSPLAQSPDIAEQGKTLYEAKGTCANCHGLKGNGRGMGAATLSPPPRNFQHHGFWRHRTEGELFWVIKHGSPGTAMIPFGGMLSDKEIWTIIQYEATFSHRPGRPDRPGSRKGHGRMNHGRGMGSDQGGNESCCGDR